MLFDDGRTMKVKAGLVAAAVMLLSACSILPTEKRHMPAEIAAYQSVDFVAPIASADGERIARESGLKLIQEAIALPPGVDPNEIVPTALGNISFLNTEKAAGLTLLMNTLPTLANRDAAYQRGVLTFAYANFPAEAAPQVRGLLVQLRSPREFAIAAYTLLKASDAVGERESIRATMRNLFPDWANEPRLQRLEYVLSRDIKSELRNRPPLVDLLAYPIRAGYPVIFSFQRQDRQRFGLAVVRAPDGKFVRNADGSLFSVAHLANAMSNLPGTITNGNTPQGLFTIVGAGTATNKWIGPTPYLHSKVPVEATVAEFEHVDELLSSTQTPNSWKDGVYQSFLPEKWRQYVPFTEALLAGRAGRDDMLLHGTTINSNYYRGASFYPGTPSAGCLVAMETWRIEDGRQLSSDQLSLAKAFTRDGLDRGYLVVVELDDRVEPVTLQDVIAEIEQAEGRQTAR
jgi:starvation-inducible outer membrane lipoprotein